MAIIIVTQEKSISRIAPKQKLTLKALGLGKIDSSVEVENTPQIAGMVHKVKHLVKVENK
jgi:large subunit ribosomal protein L30